MLVLSIFGFQKFAARWRVEEQIAYFDRGTDRMGCRFGPCNFAAGRFDLETVGGILMT